MSTTKHIIVTFMKGNNLKISDFLFLLNVYCQKLLNTLILREFIIDKTAQQHGHEMLMLPPYHCNLNVIKLYAVQGYLHEMISKWNVTPSTSSTVCQILWECVDDIDASFGRRCARHTTLIKAKYLQWDVKNNSRPLFIKSTGSQDEASSDKD